MTVTPGSVVVGYLDGGQWAACFGLSYRDLLLYDGGKSQRIVRPGGTELRQLAGSGGIPAGRNKVARAFLDDTDGEWLFMVDSDMGFAADTVDRLVDAADPATRPVMGGLCFAMVRDRRAGQAEFYAERAIAQPTLYDWVDTDAEVGFRPIVDYPRDQVVAVAGTGAACLLIHRSALAAVRAHAGDTWFDPLTHPGGRTFSEDLSFCVRLAAAGVPLHIHTGVRTTHAKGGVFLDEDTYDRQMALEALAATATGTGGETG